MNADRVLIRLAFEAYVRTAHLRPRRRGEAFIKEMGRLMEAEESLATLFPIRSARQHSELIESRHEAAAVLAQWMPTLIASLPGEDI